jgi:hypothetical protein
MAVYEIKSFIGGLSDSDDIGLEGAHKRGANLDIRKRTNSLSAGQALIDEGLHSSHSPSASVSPSLSVSSSASPSSSRSVSPTPSPSASASPSVSVSRSPSATPSFSTSPSPSPSGGITTVYKDLVLWFVKCSDGYTYEFGDTGYIYRRDSDGFVLQVYKDSGGKIKGAEEKPSSNGKRYIFWATDKVLKKKLIPGRADWNDAEVVDSNLDSADWHTMKQIGGGLKIANRDKLALVGYDDSYTNEALDLIPGNYAKTIVERNGRAIVGTYSPFNPTGGINGAIDTEYPLAQIGDDGDIYYANMADSMPAKSFPGGGKVNPGGVCNQVDQVNFFEWEETALSWIDKQTVGNMALFGVYGADEGHNGVYSYGRKRKNALFVLNLDYNLEVDEIGAIAHVNGKTLVSYRDGSDYGVKATDLTAKAEAVYEGLDSSTPVKKPIDVNVWKYAEIDMKPLPSGSWIQFYYKLDKDGDFIQARSADGLLNYNTADSKQAVFSISANAKILEPRVVLHPYGNESPEVLKIKLHFD